MYRQVHHTFWTDPKVKKLSTSEKLLFLYFITNPHSHFSGIYYLPLSLIEEETGFPRKEIHRLVNNLSKANIIRYDTENSIVWVINMLKYQAGEKKNEKQLKGIANHLRSLHNSSILKEFLTFYDTLSIPYEYPIDTLSIPYRTPIGDMDKDKDIDIYNNMRLKRDANPSIKKLQLYFTYLIEKHKGFKPEINFSKTGKLLQSLLRRYTDKQIADIIKFVVIQTEDKFLQEISCDLSAILSAGVINRILSSPVYRLEEIDYEKEIERNGNKV